MCCLSYYPVEFLSKFQTQTTQPKKIFLSSLNSSLLELLNVRIGDWIQGVGIVQTEFEQKFVRNFVRNFIDSVLEINREKIRREFARI